MYIFEPNSLSFLKLLSLVVLRIALGALKILKLTILPEANACMHFA